MKTTLKIFAAIVMIAGFSTTLMAQSNTKNTAAGAKIVKALTLTQTSALHFGTMTIPTAAEDLELTTGTVRIPSAPANITLLTQIPIPANAAYTVAGSAAGAYTISLPANDIVKITNGTPAVDMYVNSFTAKTLSAGIDGFTGLLDINGADSFVVGATLKLANAQPFGVYAGTFDVTVNYN